MPSNTSLYDLAKYFNTIKDPRVERQKLHALPDILLIVFCGVICGAETWQHFEDFGRLKMDYLQKYAELKNGIPSKNTFNRVISVLDPNAFKECFISWVRDFKSELGDIIAIDGKTLRRSYDKASERSAIHMVSAFASEARLVLAQEKVNEKSNEITAIPRLLDSLNLQNSVVTIDAMGCQKNIAEKIITARGDYVLAVKGNQGKLHQQIKTYFNNLLDGEHNKHVNCSVITEKSRGRIESRKCLATENLCWLDVKNEWTGIKSCIVLESSRTVADKTTKELRYYISSLASDAESLNKIIRSHWAIENSLHWILDVVFSEDYSRIRMGNAAENMSMIKHVVLNKLQAAKPSFRKGMSIKSLRKNAGWDDAVLDTILRADI